MPPIIGAPRRPTIPGVLKRLLVGLCVITLTAFPAIAAERKDQVLAAMAAMAGSAPAPWRQTMLSRRPTTPGCFQSRYPAMAWKVVACIMGGHDARLAFPRSPPRPLDEDLAGNQTALSSGNITGAIGKLSQSGVTEAAGRGLRNSFSIQLNTNYFDSPYCRNHPNCIAIEQFVVDSNGYMEIQLWLFGYLSKESERCPDSSWQIYENSTITAYLASCYKTPAITSENIDLPVHVFNQLNNIIMSASASKAGKDVFVMELNGVLTLITLPSGMRFGLFGRWTDVDFNVYGESNDEVVFNPGAKLEVEVALIDGAPEPPKCRPRGLNGGTGETSNLKAGPCTSFPARGGIPHGIRFSESVGPPPTGPIYP